MRPLPPRLRKLALTSHVAVSVGWLGAVLAFLALAIAGLTGSGADGQAVRGAYLGMEVVAWWAILPLALASLASGLVQGWGTEWGVLRHYWVAAKLLITVAATLLLLVHLQPISFLGDMAAAGPLAPEDHRAVRVQMVVEAALAVAALLVATGLSVFKPRGLTPRGRRHLRRRAGPEA